MIQGVFLFLTHVGHWRIQYFPDDWGANPKGGANLWIIQFSRKLHEEKHWLHLNPPMSVPRVKGWKIVHILKLKPKNKEKHQMCSMLLKMLFENQFAMIFIHGKKYEYFRSAYSYLDVWTMLIERTWPSTEETLLYTWVSSSKDTPVVLVAFYSSSSINIFRMAPCPWHGV